MKTGKITPTPESEEVVRVRQQYDREVYELRQELSATRQELAESGIRIRKQLLYQEGGQMLCGMVDRYRRAIAALGWSAPDDEGALIEKIRKDLEQ